MESSSPDIGTTSSVITYFIRILMVVGRRWRIEQGLYRTHPRRSHPSIRTAPGNDGPRYLHTNTKSRCRLKHCCPPRLWHNIRPKLFPHGHRLHKPPATPTPLRQSRFHYAHTTRCGVRIE